jgi:hypothetical protein
MFASSLIFHMSWSTLPGKDNPECQKGWEMERFAQDQYLPHSIVACSAGFGPQFPSKTWAALVVAINPRSHQADFLVQIYCSALVASCQSPLGHAALSLSKFHTRQIERRRISDLVNNYKWLWHGETHRRLWI